MNAKLTLPPLPKLQRRARLWLAYSGGLDSTVLLHLLAAAGLPRLSAIHVHHGLQAAAEAWAQKCEARCRALDVPCTVMRVCVDTHDPAGPEAAARKARYAALHAQMKAGDLLITAHHQDDQAETVLLRLLRGTGIAGLAAMRPLTDFPPGRLWRPLLHTPRTEIHAYAQQHGLSWIDDPHNQNPRYARAFLRSEILPRLRQHWPQAQESLARTAQHAAEAEELLQELAGADLKKVRRSQDSANRLDALSCAALMELSPARRNNVIRYWLTQTGFEVPAAGMLLRLDMEVMQAREDAQPLLHCGACEFRRYRDGLYVMPPLPPPPEHGQLEWNGAGTLQLPAGCGRLMSSARKALPFALRVCFPQGGERIRPRGSAHTRTLKNLFQEAALPPWVRVRTPLIYRNDELISVADRWVTEAWAEELKRRRVHIRWQRE